jgi:hypothetical protein
MKIELLQPAATITAALIANTSVSSTTDDKISKLFADVYAQLLKSLPIIEQREAPPAD